MARPVVNVGPHLLGRTVEHDPRNRTFTYPARTVTRPRNIIHTLSAPCLDQGRIGSCEGNTAAEFLNSAKAIGNRRRYWTAKHLNSNAYLTEADAVDLYSTATGLDNDQIPGQYPPTDTGTSGVGIAKALQTAGAIDGYDWTFSFDAMLAAGQTQPLMLGTSWFSGMFDPDRQGFVQPASTDTNPDGGHAYLLIAINYTGQWIGCQNHWTDQWGVKIGGHPGRFKIRFPIMQRLLADQGDSLVPRLVVKAR